MGTPWPTDSFTRLDSVQDRLHALAVPRVGDSGLARRTRRVVWALFLCLVVGRNPATEGNRARALSRLLSWQVWRRVVGRPVEAVIDPGARLSFPPWSTLAAVTLATGHHELSEQVFVNSYVRAGDAVFDAGANLGVYSVPCAVLGARVIAVEPSTRAQSALRGNIELNGLEGNVLVVPVALDAVTGKGVLTTHLDVANRLEAPGSSPGQEVVQVRTVDSVMADSTTWLGDHRLSLVKIDCEGHDEGVIRGGVATIDQHRPVIMVETWDGGSSVRRLLAEHGYRVYRFHHTTAELVEYPASWSGQANFIAVPDDQLAVVTGRLAERPPPRPGLPAVRWRSAMAPMGG